MLFYNFAKLVEQLRTNVHFVAAILNANRDRGHSHFSRIPAMRSAWIVRVIRIVIEKHRPRHGFRMPICKNGINAFSTTVGSAGCGPGGCHRFVNSNARSRSPTKFHDVARILRRRENDECSRICDLVRQHSGDVVSIQTITDRRVRVVFGRRSLIERRLKNLPRSQIFWVQKISSKCVVVSKITPSLSFMYICVARPSWRRLLMSCTTRARS